MYSFSESIISCRPSCTFRQMESCRECVRFSDIITERESIQVGVGMVCRGEVALIVANRGLSMGVLSSAMMTPVVITVVGGTILTPILLKLVFRGEPQEKLVESRLADRYEKPEQLEDASQQLLDADAAMMRKNK
jgi:hypothetical protein